MTLTCPNMSESTGEINMVGMLSIRFRKNLWDMFIQCGKKTKKQKQKHPNFVFRSCVSKYHSQQCSEIRYSSKGMVKQIQPDVSNRSISERQVSATHFP